MEAHVTAVRVREDLGGSCGRTYVYTVEAYRILPAKHFKGKKQ